MLNLGVEVEEGFDALAELVFDLLAAALENVHGDVGLFAVFEGNDCVAYFDRFLGRKEPHAVDQCEISHGVILPLDRKTLDLNGRGRSHPFGPGRIKGYCYVR